MNFTKVFIRKQDGAPFHRLCPRLFESRCFKASSLLLPSLMMKRIHDYLNRMPSCLNQSTKGCM